MERLLPRHLDLIYKINHFFLESIRDKVDLATLSRLSLIEESNPKQVRMANVCIICSTYVNGVAEIHSELLKTDLFNHFYTLYPKKFKNVTNGVTPRRWIHCAFPELSHLLTEYSGGNDDWLADLSTLEYVYDSDIVQKGKLNEFISKYKDAKLCAKRRMKAFVKKTTGIDIDEHFLFDIMVKRIHEYKRQFMNCLYCIHRYLKIKRASPEERNTFVKRVTFFGGKAAPGYAVAKNVIKLINMVGAVINNDPEVNQYFKVVFLPDYKVSSAQIIIPSADISQHISTAGTEASGTSCMKFTMTGSMIIGTHDGANIEIAREIVNEKEKKENIFFFGNKVDDVRRIRNEMFSGKREAIPVEMDEAFQAILNNTFGDTTFMHDYVRNMIYGCDYYLYTYDFKEYMQAQEKVDKEYADSDEWAKCCVYAITHMGKFSSDRSIKEYGENIWDVKELNVPMPKTDIHTVSSFENLKALK